MPDSPNAAHVLHQRVNTPKKIFGKPAQNFSCSTLTRLYLHTSTILHLFGAYWCILVYTYTKHKRKGAPTMPRLSITLTDSQARALDLIAAETGATRQSMIGLAVTSWIRSNEHLAAPTREEPENVPQAVCEVCGAPAVGGCIGPDGQHLYCEEHRALFDDDDMS